MANLTLRLSDGTAIVAPNTIRETTPYVLLEQGRWFEKEPAFLERWLRPGMTAIDIGANAGVYALPMARLVGPAGSVVAFEPARATRERLLAGQAANGADNLTIVDAALSDREGSTHLAYGESSETNALGSSGAGETVRLATLDREPAVQAAGRPDFIKIDAEGVEERIIAGGRALLSDTSPVIMFELSGDSQRTPGAAGRALAFLGYDLYRLLEHGPLLVPVQPGQALDPYELNLFAMKPDRAAMLEGEGLLVRRPAPWTPWDAGWGELARQDFMKSFSIPGGPSRPYAEALAAYTGWRLPGLSPDRRVGALAFAYRRLGELCAEAPSLPRLGTFARVALEAGERKMALQALFHATRLFQQGGMVIGEPFWPSSRRYDGIAPGERPGEWFMAAITESHELARAYSSKFGPHRNHLDWLIGTGFASDEMHRRKYLVDLRQNPDLPVPEQVRRNSSGYLNGEAWALFEPR